MPASKFRAIIIGGGPVGLTIANGLSRAAIDFLLVERYPTILSDSGAGVVLWPHTVRIFDQLGLYEACQGRFIDLLKRAIIKADGTLMRTEETFDILLENHGYECMNFPRTNLVRTLYEGLTNEESRIRLGVGVEDIEETRDGVRVHFSDGSVEEGSIVIGADGVHSKTRALMWKLAKASKGIDLAKEEKPITSSYQILYGRATTIPGLEQGTFFESHDTGRCTQITAGKKTMHFGIYRKLPVETTEIKKDYSKEEVDEFLSSFDDVSVMPNLTFKELVKNFEWTRLVNQHEGLMEHWYSGRVVLAGDSCAQMTSAFGMGVNVGIESGIVLVNKLHEILSRTADPDAETLERALSEYQAVRREESREVCRMAATVIRAVTWESWISWLLADKVIPKIIPHRALITRFGKKGISKSHKLNFIDKDLKEGNIPWAVSPSTA
ncbi:FAD/NAD(P)-binding domain-containing protein [Xylariaceae sp. FL0255]|nr:FAD/NAD(P)-binding domain-containing protein [Xylariaceae sp. FL0255]